MNWWLRARRSLITTAVTAVYLAALAVVGDVRLPVPALLAGFGQAIPVAEVLPLGLAIVLAYAIDNDDLRLGRLSVRPLWLLDLGLVAITFVGLIGGAVLEHFGVQRFGLAAGRNGAGYIGLLLILRALVGGRAAATLTASFVVIALMFGEGPSGRYPWAWPIADVGNLPVAIGVGVLFVVGLVGLRFHRTVHVLQPE